MSGWLKRPHRLCRRQLALFPVHSGHIGGFPGQNGSPAVPNRHCGEMPLFNPPGTDATCGERVAPLHSYSVAMKNRSKRSPSAEM